MRLNVNYFVGIVRGFFERTDFESRQTALVDKHDAPGRGRHVIKALRPPISQNKKIPSTEMLEIFEDLVSRSGLEPETY